MAGLVCGKLHLRQMSTFLSTSRFPNELPAHVGTTLTLSRRGKIVQHRHS